jgi:hypothetical protein
LHVSPNAILSFLFHLVTSFLSIRNDANPHGGYSGLPHRFTAKDFMDRHGFDRPVLVFHMFNCRTFRFWTDTIVLVSRTRRGKAILGRRARFFLQISSGRAVKLRVECGVTGDYGPVLRDASGWLVWEEKVSFVAGDTG